MTKLTVHDLAPFYRNAIGVDRILDAFSTALINRALLRGIRPITLFAAMKTVMRFRLLLQALLKVRLQ